MRRMHVVGIVASTAILALVSAMSPAYCAPHQSTVTDAQTTDTERDVATKSNPSPEYPVIGSLKARKGTIVIMSGPDGPLYTVTDSSGVVVQRRLSEKELQARHPKIYDQIKGALADGTVWAGM